MQKYRFQSIIVTMVTLALTACAPSGNGDIEAARFALDSGDYATAITKAQAALTADSTDVDAAMVLSSAYAGQAGARLLAIVSDISDTGNTDNEFEAIHDAFVASIPVENLADLRSAITTLTATLTEEPAEAHEMYADFNFQLGILEIIEAFAAPSITAQPTVGGAIDPTDIASEADYEADFIDVDDRLINAGMAASDDLVEIIRKNYCVLHDLSAGNGFDLDVLQDMVHCQLSDSAGSVTTTADGVINCAAFATEFTACNNPGATEL